MKTGFVLLTLALAAAAVADPGVSWSSYNYYSYGDITIGYQFDVTAPVTVYALGFFTNPNKGSSLLLQNHEVGLWNGVGTQLADATVTNSSMVIGDFRWTSITPVTLAAGQDYQVAGFTTDGGDAWGYGGYSDFTGFTTAPGITNTIGVYTYASGFTEPFYHTWPMYGGGNILTNAVPEPGPFAIFGLGALGLLIRRRTRKH